MKKLFLVLLISIWLFPVHAKVFQSDCKEGFSAKTEQFRDKFDKECFENRSRQRNVKEIKEFVRLIKIFMSEVNKGHLTEDFAIFLFSMKTELVKAGFTEKQAMTFLSFSGQLLYEQSQEL